MKRLLHVAFALIVGSLILASQVRADAPETCKTPVFLAEFLRGLDYQKKTIVYVKKDLKCELKGMSVIFKISDITQLTVYSFPEKEYERAVKGLPIDDPRREEWKKHIDEVYGLQVDLRDYRPVKIARRFGKRFQALGVRLLADTPFSRPVQIMKRAYERKDRATLVWARVKLVETGDPSKERIFTSRLDVQAYKVEKRSG